MVTAPIVRSIVTPISSAVGAAYSHTQGYYKRNRVLDLITDFTSADATIPDKSPFGNDATLYTGRYASTNGSSDRLFKTPGGSGIDLTGIGTVSAIRFKARAAIGETLYFGLGNFMTVSDTQTLDNEWEDHEILTTAVASNFRGACNNGETLFSEADWSDIRVVGSVETVRYQLNESAAADLDGYPALDSSGNGYHGTHTGCAGGTGEGVDADVRGISTDLDDRMWFGGVDDSITIPEATLNGDFTLKFTMPNPALVPSSGMFFSDTGVSGDTRFYISGDEVRWTGETPYATLGISFSSNDTILEMILQRVGSTITLYVNGVSSGTETDSATFIINSIGAQRGVGGAISGFNGLIWDVEIEGVSYPGTGNQPSDWNGATVNGDPVTVGQKRATILQTAGMDWNKRMWFAGSGSGDYVSLGTIASFASYTEIRIKCSFSCTDNTSRIFSILHSATDDIRASITVGGDLSVGVDDGTAYDLNFGSGYNDGAVHTIDLILNGSGLSVTVDESTTLTNGSATFDFSTANALCLIGSQSSNPGANLMKGTVYDFEIYNQSGLQHSYQGYGNTNGDWEDQVGSNDGTVNGSPANLLIPASDAAPTEDALGNAIVEPRVNDKQLNFFGDGEYAEVADADSLDLTTEATWELWGNFYGDFGADKDFLAKGDVSAGANIAFLIFQDDATADGELSISFGDGAALPKASIPVSDATQCVTFTYSSGTVKGYVNGSEVTVTVYSGSIPSSLQQNSDSVLIGANSLFNRPAERLIGSPKIYSRALTAAEVLQNFNAQKSQYGL